MFFIGLFGWDLTEFNLACKSKNLYYLPCYYDDFHNYDGWAIGAYFLIDVYQAYFYHYYQGFCTYSDSNCILITLYLSYYSFGYYGFSFYSRYVPGYTYS